MRSTDGVSWTELPTPTPTSFAWPNAVAVGPGLDAVYVGNLHLHVGNGAGTRWTDLNALHDDQTAVAGDALGRLLSAGDGGIFRLANSAWTSLNQTLPLAEIYGIAAHPTNPLKLLIGTQDNGTIEFLGSAG